MNYRFTIQYDGTEFHGWQAQGGSDERTVQGELERALSLLEGRRVIVYGAGRTDAGVHAEAQVANAHLTREWTNEKLRGAMNGNLPRDVRVMEAQTVDDNFHARFSAVGKTYCYRIFNAPYTSPFWLRFAHGEPRPLDLEAMQRAAALFIGEHDWTAFSSAQTDVLTRMRRVTKLEVMERFSERGRGRMIEITASADGFLRYMVRSIAGTLLGVGRGETDEARITRAFATGDRKAVGATAPACGLTLVKVHYHE
ncbi:MAG: tRNA pseudouridine(38-40) synthase TruA [Pyrinomonadaceae bacterium]|nr:tRNA pseudouridine(38-40) synthase TruA [Pyrinomonadaceae bacterium]